MVNPLRWCSLRVQAPPYRRMAPAGRGVGWGAHPSWPTSEPAAGSRRRRGRRVEVRTMPVSAGPWRRLSGRRGAASASSVTTGGAHGRVAVLPSSPCVRPAIFGGSPGLHRGPRRGHGRGPGPRPIDPVFRASGRVCSSLGFCWVFRAVSGPVPGAGRPSLRVVQPPARLRRATPHHDPFRRVECLLREECLLRVECRSRSQRPLSARLRERRPRSLVRRSRPQRS